MEFPAALRDGVARFARINGGLSRAFEGIEADDWEALREERRRGSHSRRAWRELTIGQAVMLLRLRRAKARQREALPDASSTLLSELLALVLHLGQALAMRLAALEVHPRTLAPHDGFDFTRPATAPPLPARRQGRAAIAI